MKIHGIVDRRLHPLSRSQSGRFTKPGDGEVPERVTVRRLGATALTPGDRVGIRVLGKAVAYDL